MTKRALLRLKKKSTVTPQGCIVTRSGLVTDHGFEVREIVLRCPNQIDFKEHKPKAKDLGISTDLLAFRRSKYGKLD